MNSQNLFQASNDIKQQTSLDKSSSIQFQLTYDQYTLLQFYLPKKYALLQYKPGKRNQSGSNIKYAQQDAQNISKLSGNYDNTQENQGRSKRQKPNKKIDRFLQNQVPQKSTKRISTDRFSPNIDDQLMPCYNILVQLKKHKSAYPFLQPVDPKLDGALNYFDIVKEPMDISTIQSNLKSGQYQTASQFHGDINKIWMNSYAYNQKNTPLYKLTLEVQKYYKNLCNNEGIAKKNKIIQEKQQKPRADKSKQVRKQLTEKIQEKQQLKEVEKNSVSEGKNQNVFSDCDQFL